MPVSESSPAVIRSSFPGVGPNGQATIQSLNPTHPSRIIAVAEGASVAELSTAIQAAAEAQAKWAQLSGPGRAEALYKWADAIASRTDELAKAIVDEVGKPIGEAKGEVGRCVAILRYFAGDAVRETGDVIPGLLATSLQYSVRSPLGVVGLITPWNFPLAIPLWKAAPALAWGNAVVLKPSEYSIYCASLLAETAQAAGLPEGLFSVMIGDGPTLGEALMKHPLVKAISFTGSAKVGAIVAATCAARNIKFQTEMGGKNPGIVLADADLAQAAGLIAGGAMRFAGQKCTATSRVIVEKSKKAEFLAELAKAANGLPVGDPADMATAVGPVINEASFAKLWKVLDNLKFETLPRVKVPSDGYFVPPTVVLDVPANDSLAQDELFGPVLSVIEADDFDHAIEIANGIEFGLSAAVYTRNLGEAFKYIRKIKAGLVRVNGDTTGVDPHAPFGGVKGSSSGTREQGPAARDFYTEVQTVQINP